MKDRKITFTKKTISFFFSGFFVIGLGVSLMKRTEIGAGAWDATNFSLNDLLRNVLPNISVGTTSFIVGMMLFLTVFIYRKFDKKLLAMFLPMVLIWLCIDFWDIIIFGTYLPEPFVERLILFVLGMVLIPFGLSLVVASKFPGTVYDEFTLMLREVTKIDSFGKVRLIVEGTGIALALIFSLIDGEGLGYINVGTLVMAVVLGPIMNFYLLILGARDKKVIANG